MDLERIQFLETEKLKDLVKNYKRYGYGEEVQREGIRLLMESGFTERDLKLMGLFENPKEDYAQALFADFKKASYKAMLLYSSLLAMRIVIPFLGEKSQTTALFILIFSVLIFVTFIYFLVKSFIYQSEFYRSLNQKNALNHALIFLILGIPLYFVLFLVSRKQMSQAYKYAGF